MSHMRNAVVRPFVVLTLLVLALVPAPGQASQKGKDAIAEKAIAEKAKWNDRGAFLQLPYLSVAVSEMPDALAKELGEELSEYTEAELARLAPTLKVMTTSEQLRAEKRAPPQAPSAGLDRMFALSLLYFDDSFRRLCVNVDAMKTDDLTVFVVGLQLDREVALPVETELNPSGRWMTRATVWETSRFGYFGSAHDAKTTIKDLLHKLISEFADKWVIANKPDAPQTPRRK